LISFLFSISKYQSNLHYSRFNNLLYIFTPKSTHSFRRSFFTFSTVNKTEIYLILPFFDISPRAKSRVFPTTTNHTTNTSSKMLSQTVLLALLSTSSALMITSPTKNQLWDLSKENTIVWNSVNTDPQTFDIYLSHMSASPPSNTLLVANENKDAGSYTVKGLQLPIGEAYQINFVAHDKPEQIYAQSQQFNTTGEAIAATSTLDGYTGPTYTGGSASQTSSTTQTDDDSQSTTTATTTGTTVRTTSRATTITTGSSTFTTSVAETTTDAVVATTTGPVASVTSARPTNAGAVSGASAPLAALVFGVAAFFL